MPGSLQKLSVAVVLDHAVNEDGERVPLEQTLLDQVNALVREAIGFSAERGDTVQIINSPFIAPVPLEPIPEPGFLAAVGLGVGSSYWCGCNTRTYLCCSSSNDKIFDDLYTTCISGTVSARNCDGYGR